MELTNEQKKVLKACIEEPGFKEAIVKESRLDEPIVESSLKELRDAGLIYSKKEKIAEKEDEFWSSTAEGDKVYESIK